MIPVEFLYCGILKTTDCAFLQQIYSITNYLGEQDFFYNLINILITNMSVAILEQQKQQQSLVMNIKMTSMLLGQGAMPYNMAVTVIPSISNQTYMLRRLIVLLNQKMKKLKLARLFLRIFRVHSLSLIVFQSYLWLRLINKRRNRR